MLYWPAANWLASNVAVDWVIPFEGVPIANADVPRTDPPELKAITPEGPAPVPIAVTATFSNSDCAVCCEVRAVVVASCPIVKLMGVRFELLEKLLSP